MRAPKIVILSVCITLSVCDLISLRAQTLGDYRSAANGNWSSLSTWQYYNGTAWVAAINYPGQLSMAPTVSIQSPHTVTLDVNPAYSPSTNDLTINSGASLVDSPALLSYNLQVQNYTSVYGTLNFTNTSNINSAIRSNYIFIYSGALFSAHTVRIVGLVANGATATITRDVINLSPISTTFPFPKGTWVNQAGSTFNFLGSSLTCGLIASSFNNTVNYSSSSSTSNQTIRAPAISYFNLTISGSNQKILSANTEVENNLSIQGTSSFSLGGFNLSVGGDWNNSSTSTSAIATSLPATGTITFNGSSQQAIINTGHSSGTEFYNLAIANTSATIPQITISNTSGSPTKVASSLTMTSGVVDLVGSTFQIGDNYTNPVTITHSGASSSGWFYNGSILRLFLTNLAISAGSTSGLIPVGTSTNFRPLYISTVTPPSVITRMAITAPGATSFADVAITDGTATINRQNRSGWAFSSLGNGTYNIRAGGTGLGIIGNVADLRLTPATLVLGSAGTNTGTTSNPLVERTGLSLVNLNTTFYVGSVNLVSSPLPVELISFSGETEGSVVNLNWVTKSELNCDYFTVYRSLNGIDFVSIGNKKGGGTTNEFRKYHLQDTSPLDGTNYYRLEQTDWDGKKTILSMISVNANGSEAIQIYPNPVEREHTLELKFQGLIPDSDESIVIINQLGQQVFNSIIHVDEIGSFIGSFKIPQLSTGSYFIKINGKVKRLLVQ